MDVIVPISALQHFIFCPRQCALIHVERVWSENYYTVQGRIMHEKVHDGTRETRKNVRIERGLSLKSMAHGLTGIADVVEFHLHSDGSWLPFPVEYKRGKPKNDDCDEVQLCAQALCLEEMMNVSIPDGALFYGKTRKRVSLILDSQIRKRTIEVVGKTRELFINPDAFPVHQTKRCKFCSLRDICLPEFLNCRTRVAKYIDKMTAD